MLRRNASWILFAATLASIALLSERSGYSIRDVKSINLEIAMMLSPWGLLNNLVIQKDHYLRPYYLEATDRGALFMDPPMVAIVCLVIACAGAGLWTLRKRP